VAAVLVLLGALVTGSGPHSGDSADVPRMDLPGGWTAITVVHGVAAVATIGLAAGLLLLLRSGGAGTALARRRVAVLLAVLGAQALVGIVQALTALPGQLVVVHLLGAALVWVGVLRVLLDTHPTLFGGVIPARDAPAAARTADAAVLR
jgi:heme a synthase